MCCNALLAAYARAHPPQWPKALRLLDAMGTFGGELAPDIVSYNTVMKARARGFGGGLGGLGGLGKWEG